MHRRTRKDTDDIAGVEKRRELGNARTDDIQKNHRSPDALSLAPCTAIQGSWVADLSCHNSIAFYRVELGREDNERDVNSQVQVLSLIHI